MAALTPRPRNRVHFAVRFAASAMRVAAIVGLLAGGAATYGLFNLPQLFGVEGISDVVVYVTTALVVALTLLYALVLWGFADSLILLADLDDTQRLVQGQLADLVLEHRTQRGPFRNEALPAKTEQLKIEA